MVEPTLARIGACRAQRRIQRSRKQQSRASPPSKSLDDTEFQEPVNTLAQIVRYRLVIPHAIEHQKIMSTERGQPLA